MELVSVKIRNYRIHKEINIDFDSGLNLIIGNNETGKSTIADAIHRALFFQVKGNTEEHKSMKPFTGGLNPEIHLTFIHQEQQYVLTKIFGAGQITLNTSGSNKTGDDAETELGRILGEQTGVKGSAYGAKWQHLWIWQGKSGEDMLKTVNEKQQELFQNLQKNGPAVLILSELDKMISSDLRDNVAKMLTEKGQYRTSSDYFNSKEKKEVCLVKEKEARDKYEKLLLAAGQLDEVEHELKSSLVSHKEFEMKFDVLRKDLETIKELKGKKELTSAKREAAKKELETFNNDCNQLISFRQKREKIQELITPLETTVKSIEKNIDDYKKELKLIEAEINHAEEKLTQEGKKANYFRKLKDCAAKSALLENKKSINTRITGLRADLLNVNSEFKKLPEISEADYSSLSKLEKAISENTAVLESISTGIEFLEIKGNVSLSGDRIKKGQQVTITSQSLIELQNGTQILIKPGGGDQLETKAKALQLMIKEKKELFVKFRASSLEHAYELMIKRNDLAKQAKQIKDRIADMDADNLDVDIQNLELDIIQMLGDAKSDADLLGISFVNTDNMQFISEELSKIESILNDEDVSVSQLRLKSRDLQERTEELSMQLKQQKDTLQEKKDDLLSSATLEKSKIAQLGDENNRTKKLQELQTIFNSLSSELEQIEKELFTLNFEEIEGDTQRIERSIQNLRTRIEELQRNKIRLETELRQDGGRDFQEEHTAAIAQREEAERIFESVRKRSEALIMLDSLFQEEQQKITDAYIAPFKDKISKYLRIIFGKDVDAQIEVSGTEFSRLALYREFQGTKHSMNFESLSGGAKEQFSNAVRLAMAEVLAESHDGKLPVVLDESFNNTDPSRMQAVHRMLDTAAQNGLQLIILSSNPNDYLGLGANEYRLSS